MLDQHILDENLRLKQERQILQARFIGYTEKIAELRATISQLESELNVRHING